MTVRGAAKHLKIPSSTASDWEKKALKHRMNLLNSESPEVEDLLADLLRLVDENETGFTLDQMMESLTTQFMDLKISKSAFHEFARTKCRISCKRAHFQPEERNSPAKIEQRYNWVEHWEGTDLDFESNCVFIDEAGFHINMKRSFAWSRVGNRPIIKTPKTKSKTTTILGAVSALGIVNVKVRLPKVVQSKKRI
jgi:hypothetical protein